MEANDAQVKWTLLNDAGKEVTSATAEADLGIPKHLVRNDIKHRGAQNYNALRSIRCLMSQDRFAFKERVEYDTKYGSLTCNEIYDAHPFKKNVNVRLLRRRLNNRGGMCESLWWDKLPPKVLAARLMEAGISSTPVVKRKSVAPPVERYKQLIHFDKTSTCFCSGKCVHYDALLSSVNYDRRLPTRCAHVVANMCKNYTLLALISLLMPLIGDLILNT